jgi:phosphoribosylamine--glycine ligase
MKVLVVGSGGREHALVWKIRQSPLVRELYCAPGNAGISRHADCVPIETSDIVELADFAQKIRVDLTVVGPELPLNLGIADEFRKRGLKILGPRKGAAEIEASKVFAKEFMSRHGIPTAPYRVFRAEAEAVAYLKARGTKFPIVVKADGLAAGKGVVVAADREEATAAVRTFMGTRTLGAAGDAVVVEERLEGTEVSFFALCDGARFIPWPTCQDFKRALDGDGGPNTGGMGSYSPSPYVDADLFKEIVSGIITPTVAGLAKEGRAYEGVLYAGLMLTTSGPMVLEYNARLGDPEAEAILPRMKSDIVPSLVAAAEGALPAERPIEWRREPSVTVILAAKGYPGAYEKGKTIQGLEAAEAQGSDTILFHSGTRRLPTGEIQTSGGRVLAVTGLGPTLEAAAANAYSSVERIRFEGMSYRKDIAAAAIRKIASGREAAG